MSIKEVNHTIRLSGLLLCAVIVLLIGNTPALADGEGTSLQATMAEPEFYAPVFLEEMSPVSPEEMERREEALERTHLPGPPLPRTNLPIIPPSKESQTSPVELSNTEGSEGEGLLLLNPEDFMIGLNRRLGSGAPDGYKSTVGEPQLRPERQVCLLQR